MTISADNISLEPLLAEDIPLFEQWLNKAYIYISISGYVRTAITRKE